MSDFGEKEYNSTKYSGALGYLQEKKGDMLFTFATQYIKKDFFKHSQPAHHQK